MACNCTGQFANVNITLNTLQNDFNSLTGNILYNYNQLTRVSSQISNVSGVLTNGTGNIVTGNLIVTNNTNITKNLTLTNGNINVTKDLFLSNVITLGTDNGLSGEVIRSSGTSTLPIWNSAILTGTTQTLNGLSSGDFTGIPSWANRVTMIIDGASTVGTNDPILYLGTSSGYATSGYLGAVRGNNAAASQNYTNFIYLWNSGTWAGTYILYTTIVLYNMGSNLWVFEFTSSRSDGAYAATGTGSIALSGTLDRIRVSAGSTGAGGTFDAGSVNIQYN